MSSRARARLDAHHGGAQFHDVMLKTFEGRFGADFWDMWSTKVVSHHAEAPTYVDLGCGPGLMLRTWRERWPEANLHGVELQAYMLETAKRVAAEADATLHDADLHTLSLPLADGSVDAALVSMVIHEMQEPIGLLREARRLLAPTGRLVVMDWVRIPLSEYLERSERDPFHLGADPGDRADLLDHFMEHNKFSRDDLLWLLERMGFEVEHTQTRGDGQFLWLVARPAPLA